MKFLRLIAISISFAIATWAQAQQRTIQPLPYEDQLVQLAGDVMDPSGAVVSQAQIRVISRKTGVWWGASG
jgi:hypothetical protein